MPKQMRSGDAARKAMQTGINEVVDIVKITLGPRGRNVVIDRGGQPMYTRDGVTVAKEVSNLPDPFAQVGAMLARETADGAVMEAGDGTTTASVLLAALVNNGSKLVANGANPLALASGIDIAAKRVSSCISTMACPATDELIRQVATVSTHGDTFLGALVGSAMAKVGEHGVVTLAESQDQNCTLEHVEGFHFQRGWHPHAIFQNDFGRGKCILERPLILLSERIITGGAPGVAGHSIFNVLDQAARAQRPLLIIAEDLTGDALNIVGANVAKGTLKACFVKLPAVGDQRKAALKDLQIAIGAARVHTTESTAVQDLLSSFVIADLGTCDVAEVSARSTVLIRGGGHEAAIKDRVKELLRQQSESPNPLEKEQLSHRIARLAGGVAVIRVGAASEPALYELKARVEDAVHAARGAREAGVVPGGGVALVRAGQAVGPALLDEYQGDVRIGIQLLLSSITMPVRQIAANAGQGDGSAILDKTMSLTGAWGYNAAAHEFQDLLASGIVDPAKVVQTALEKAASNGALMLTTDAIVCDLPQHHAAQPGNPFIAG